MLEFLREWVINIVTLALFVVMLEMFLPSGRIKKFVNLVSGIILIIAIVNPLIGFLKKGIDIKDFQVANSNFIDMREIERNGKYLQAEQVKMIVEEYRKKLINQVVETAKQISGAFQAKADVIINEDYEAENFGEIRRVYVYLTDVDKNNETKPVTKIDKIEIPERGEKETENEQVSIEIREKLENKISSMFGVEKENIVISALKE